MAPAPPLDADPRVVRLLAMLTRWRDDLLQHRAQVLTEQQFGQLITLNTVLSYVHHEWD